MKRMITTAVAIVLAFSLTACVQPSATPLPPSHGEDVVRCGPDQHSLTLSALHSRQFDQLQPDRYQLIEETHLAVIVVAGSPAPGYQGIQVGTGVTGLNPLVISGLATYSATLCWDLQYPVALLVRIGANTSDLRLNDHVECFIEDGNDPARDFVSHDTRTVGPDDFFPGASQAVFAQCQEIYVPAAGDYAGVRPALLPGMRDQ